MTLEVGDYRIRSDKYNVWIEKALPKRSETTKEISYECVCGYHSTFNELLKRFANTKLHVSECTELKSLLQEISSIESQLEEFIDAITNYIDEPNNLDTIKNFKVK